MLTVSHLYGGKEKFAAFAKQNGLDEESECLARIYTADCGPEEAVEIAREIKAVLPCAQIFGASGSGVIYNGVQCDQDTLVVLEKLVRTRVETHTFTYHQKSPAEVAEEIVRHAGSGAVLMHLVCGERYPDVDQFVREFNKRNGQVRLVGGIAGDVLLKNMPGYVFTDEGRVENGIVTATYYNENLHIYHSVNISHEPISPVYTLDKCQDSLLLEIEGRPAVDWCKEQLGLKTMEVYDEDWKMIAENDALLRFPLVLEGHGGASRFIRFDQESREMGIYFVKLPDKTPFRIGYVSPTKCVSELYAICNEIEQHPIESLFCYTCLFRKLYLQNCAEWELRPFAELGVCGVFMMGEICCIDGVNEFFNGSCCLAGIAEEQTRYIQPDYSAFSDFYQIKDDFESLLHFVLKKQSEEMSRENKNLLAKLVNQQSLLQNQLYTDANTGMPNSIKFLQKDHNQCFNKLCMIVIDNAELLISRMGKAGYFHMFKDISEEICHHCRRMPGGESIQFYVQSETVMFLSANDRVSESMFVEMANSLYGQLQYRKLESKKELLISRFVLVLNQNDLLEKAFSTLKNYANLQTDFLVWDSSIESGEPHEDEMNMICILNQAIEEERVIPFFQGIYDNQSREISKYEALMRIQDANGVLYSPAEFMEIAKKYHLYSRISMMMVEKVLTLFAGRTEVVSINVSAYDINFTATCNRIFQRLEEIGDASNFVFEILEDEKFRDMGMLKQFIDQVRKYGVKIAIDDFGRGYSNFMEIAKIEPDFIKVDGSIIRDIANNVLHQKVSRNIVFLGSQLNADLVAEFVENVDIQEMVEELGIKYSQGYHLARPVPFRELQMEK